ncbi:MAG: hypothetical protein HFE27_03885 [Clostridia bacterium]|jgi:tRNA (adenine22-N1)-methyltransferase|nr:hypothetical protein [Clostridia bacterium]
MTKRISVICSYLPKVRVFADVGCDHGYCTEYMLKNGLCERAYISDISKGSLQKAEKLLSRFIEEGTCIPVCADGLSGINEPCDCVLIAGMGGEEIVHILSTTPLPERFVLQPMKNAEKVRAFLLSRGASISEDFTFYDGKYYDLIAGGADGGGRQDRYTDFELTFGRGNLKAPSDDFLNMVRTERDKLRARLSHKMSANSRAELSERLRYYEEVADVFEDDL